MMPPTDGTAEAAKSTDGTAEAATTPSQEPQDGSAAPTSPFHVLTNDQQRILSQEKIINEPARLALAALWQQPSKKKVRKHNPEAKDYSPVDSYNITQPGPQQTTDLADAFIEDGPLLEAFKEHHSKQLMPRLNDLAISLNTAGKVLFDRTLAIEYEQADIKLTPNTVQATLAQRQIVFCGLPPIYPASQINNNLQYICKQAGYQADMVIQNKVNHLFSETDPLTMDYTPVDTYNVTQQGSHQPTDLGKGKTYNVFSKGKNYSNSKNDNGKNDKGRDQCELLLLLTMILTISALNARTREWAPVGFPDFA
jgi:hypothetical protein